MSLNKTKGQMYPWTTHTVNPIRGACPHACKYCYVQSSRVKHLYQGKPHLVLSFFKKGLGKGKTIFMGSCFDLFAEGLYPNWMIKVLEHCRNYPDNTYLLQSKNPFVMYKYESYFPTNVIVGTTAETNRLTTKITKAPPSPEHRMAWLSVFSEFKKMISIEPIMDFDLDVFLNKIKEVKPSFVSIGADSKNHHLPEPPAGKIKELISELQKFTEVKIKPNLARLMR